LAIHLEAVNALL